MRRAESGVCSAGRPGWNSNERNEEFRRSKGRREPEVVRPGSVPERRGVDVDTSKSTQGISSCRSPQGTWPGLDNILNRTGDSLLCTEVALVPVVGRRDVRPRKGSIGSLNKLVGKRRWSCVGVQFSDKQSSQGRLVFERAVFGINANDRLPIVSLFIIGVGSAEKRVE